MTELARDAVEPRNLHFPPVHNGIDYLDSVVRYLTRPTTGEQDLEPRDLKYAVLHLQAATEVLLKARLSREHWSLVLANPGKASLKDFRSGKFVTCGVTDTLSRLQNIAGVSLRDNVKGLLEDLANDRNALQHYGLTRPANAVEARAGEVLDFLLDFIQRHLLPELEQVDAAHVRAEINRLRGKVQEIRSFATARMGRLRAELVASRTVQCPECLQWALNVDGEKNTCLFCAQDWKWEITDAYVSEVLGISWHDVIEGDSPPTAECPDCGEPLVRGVYLADAPGLPVDLCFCCGTRFDGLSECTRCGRLFQPVEQELACEACFDELMTRD